MKNTQTQNKLDLLCPNCKSNKGTRVIDTRRYSQFILRIRECLKCFHTFKTIEKYFTD